MSHKYKHSLIIKQLFLLGVFVLFALGFVFIRGWFGFKSVLLGGSAWFIPGLYFLWKMQEVNSAFDNKKMLKTFFLSEMIKLSLSFGMVALILLTCVVDRIGFLSGYIVMMLISFLMFSKYKKIDVKKN